MVLLWGDNMTEQGRFDRVLNKIESRITRVSNKISGEFVKKPPFDTEKLTPDMAIKQYLNLDPRVIETMKMQMPEQWAEYEAKIRKTMEEKYA